MTEKEIEKMVSDIEVELRTERWDSLRDRLRAVLKHCLETKSMVEANLRRCEKIIAEVKQMLGDIK